MKKLLSSILYLFFTTIAIGQTINFVNDSCDVGNLQTHAVDSNRNSGYISGLVLTINYTISQASTADTFIKDVGTYNEEAIINKSYFLNKPNVSTAVYSPRVAKIILFNGSLSPLNSVTADLIRFIIYQSNTTTPIVLHSTTMITNQNKTIQRNDFISVSMISEIKIAPS